MSCRSSSNTEPVYSFKKPCTQRALPSTARREENGVEFLRVPHQDSEVFGRQSRHFGLIARATSVSTINLDQKFLEKIVYALELSCEDRNIPVTKGIPTPPSDTIFKITRPTDLFLGGERETLSPGHYVVGNPIVDGLNNGRIFLEITPVERDGQHGKTFTAVVGIFHENRDSAGVDWRTTGRTK